MKWTELNGCDGVGQLIRSCIYLKLHLYELHRYPKTEKMASVCCVIWKADNSQTLDRVPTECCRTTCISLDKKPCLSFSSLFCLFLFSKNYTLIVGEEKWKACKKKWKKLFLGGKKIADSVCLSVQSITWWYNPRMLRGSWFKQQQKKWLTWKREVRAENSKNKDENSNKTSIVEP